MNATNSIRVTVCMAVYNGALYLEEQLNSIISQLGPNDEIIICDDRSTDKSVDLLSKFHDPRIRIILNEHRLGHVKNFESAIVLSRGDYIFLSDQDDIWVNNRLDLFIKKITSIQSPALVVGDFIEVDKNLFPLDNKTNRLKLAGSKQSLLPKALLILMGKSKYYGCCFAFHRSLIKLILPIPNRIEAHDMWISLVASIFSSVAIINDITLIRRIHDRNVTPKSRRSLKLIIVSRCIYLMEILLLINRRFIRNS